MGSSQVDGYRVETRALPRRLSDLGLLKSFYVQYARPMKPVEETVGRLRLFLIIGVLGGAGLALLAGLMVARRAMAPIAALTATARKIERTRDPGQRLPDIEADDEVAELARTLDDMLHALDASRAETEGALARQREFVADASHELRTPLTSVLANLELLADSLDGDQQDAAHSALRSSRRMRRLVADLLLLARHDAARQAPHTPTDVGQVVVEAAAELGVDRRRPRALDRRQPRDRRRRARRAAPPDAQPHGERHPPHAARHAGPREPSSASTATSA